MMRSRESRIHVTSARTQHRIVAKRRKGADPLTPLKGLKTEFNTSKTR